jgi:hypothetical protein
MMHEQCTCAYAQSESLISARIAEHKKHFYTIRHWSIATWVESKLIEVTWFFKLNGSLQAHKEFARRQLFAWPHRTRIRTNTNPNDTEANAAAGQKCTRVRCAQVKIVNRKCVEARKFGPPPPLSKVETVHEINLGPAISPFSVCFCVEEGAPLLRLLGAPRQEPPLLLRRNPSVAPWWP